MSRLETKPLAIVTGVGPGTGSALVRRFASGGFQVAMLARNHARLNALAAEVSDSIAVPCDVADQAALQDALTQIVERFGVPSVVIHNAVGGSFGKFQDIDPQVLEHNFQINVMALLHLARFLAPEMIKAGGGALIITGNTSALRGKPHFAGFAPTKATQRILAESFARDLGPQGLHVAYLVIDAVIDVLWTRDRFKEASDDFFIKPAAIANEVWHLAHQDKSAWSFLSEVRPYSETW
jgi:NAD(P)-dependent dehydrogenase (short-subunit alcohol dehydrogenase family)